MHGLYFTSIDLTFTKITLLHEKLPYYMKNCSSYATRPLLQCFLQSNLDKNTAGAHKEPRTIYKSDLRTLKSKHLVLSS